MATHNELTRRDVVRFAAAGSLVVGGSLLAGTAASQDRAQDRRTEPREEEGGEQGKEVGATEDLMREHGVLRRTLIAYREAACRLRMQQANVDAAALRDGAQLFRRFGEEYHERMLEELGEQFEEIEHRVFGADGFEDAVQRIARVEQSLGIDDLAGFTAPAPPTVRA
jgi:hypothetical protein